MKQYLDLCNRIYLEGVWVPNERTGIDCKTVISECLTFDCSFNRISMVTTRQTFVRKAIAELLGYIRGERNAAAFRELGTDTWDANANTTPAWLANKNRACTDDMGMVYGAVGNAWPKMELDDNGQLVYRGESIDLLEKVYNDLRRGHDDRGEIWTFWNPGMFELGALRPCLHTHHFSLLGDTLHLVSTQRSVDVPLGLVFNIVQVQVLLQLMAQICGLECGTVTHNLVNCHIYANQLDIMVNEQLPRKPIECSPVLEINPNIRTLEDVRTWVTPDDFKIVGYESHPSIRYPFAA